MAVIKLVFEKRSLKEGETPRGFYDHLKSDYSCLLESGNSGRYSYIAYDPFLAVWQKEEVVNVLYLKDFVDIKKSSVNQIFDKEKSWIVTDLLNKYDFRGDSPVPFCGGAAGYLSYDYGTKFVGVQQKVFDDFKIPDFVFGLYDKVIAFDHEENTIYFLALAETDIGAKRKIAEIKHDLKTPISLQRKGMVGELQSNISKDLYKEKVSQVKEFLRDGDTYQVNYSQRFSGECTEDAWVIYKKLFKENPSPYACYFQFPEMNIVSCTPELLFRKRGAMVEAWPIKGTISRGKSKKEDKKNVEELLSSTKDAAELSMIVDLERNDLGKVCKSGSVKVDVHREIEKYSHVIHTVSRISGLLDEKKTVLECIQAMFPGGSITGCPKKRTMEIIDQLEDYVRGIYTGSAGFISFSGDCDFNILIRTMLFKDETVYFNSGGGIVVDSDPDSEYQETLDKIEALMLVLQ